MHVFQHLNLCDLSPLAWKVWNEKQSSFWGCNLISRVYFSLVSKGMRNKNFLPHQERNGEVEDEKVEVWWQFRAFRNT